MTSHQFPEVIEAICTLRWSDLSPEDMTSVAWAYYYFSVQFRENLELAISRYPNDEKLLQLWREECHTDNLSPWPGVATAGERMNHDEYMLRTLALSPIAPEDERRLSAIGERYLSDMRRVAPQARAVSIASYEDGGLERVFGAILTSRSWSGELLESFKHFLIAHIQFDSDPEQGHGALSRHMRIDDSILPCWQGFYSLLVQAAPALGPQLLLESAV
jgi:hypothetical protein